MPRTGDTYYGVSLNESGKTIKTGYVRAVNYMEAGKAFHILFEGYPIERMIPIRIRGQKGRMVEFRGFHYRYQVICVSPTRKELADALYQLTKTYTDGTCYETANPYGKPHVQEALRVLARYAGTGDYLDALEKMEAIGHVYRYKQP